MKAIGGRLVAAVLAVGSGCAKTDWIDRTLVTVDRPKPITFGTKPSPTGRTALRLHDLEAPLRATEGTGGSAR